MYWFPVPVREDMDGFYVSQMTENDILLIEQAKRVPYTHWEDIMELVDKTDTEEAKQILYDIMSSLYHKEEYYAGML